MRPPAIGFMRSSWMGFARLPSKTGIRFACLIGHYEKGDLLCAGKVGTGFNQELLALLAKKFKPLAIDVCPFKNLPEKKTGRYGAGITASDMKRCHWLKPKLV